MSQLRDLQQRLEAIQEQHRPGLDRVEDDLLNVAEAAIFDGNRIRAEEVLDRLEER